MVTRPSGSAPGRPAPKGVRSARVVVVGAGAIGLAVALQLRRAGMDGVIVVDRNASPGMGSTSRANGGVRVQFTTSVNIAFSQFTIENLRRLHETASAQVGFRAVGYLFLTGTDAGEIALRRSWELQRSLGVDVRWLSPGEVIEIAPFVKVDGLSAATFCGADGIIDPHGVASALWTACRSLETTFLLDTEVLGVAAGPPALVRTSSGDIETEFVVNAAGPFARQLAATAGIDLPVISRRRNLACTESVAGIPAVIPMCVDNDTGVLIRREGTGVLIGFSDPADPPSVDTAFDPSFLDAVAARIGNRFPFLEDVPISPRKCWAGLYPETPDHHAIIDATPGAPWLVQCAGFGGHGIMHSFAAGQAVTELITDGRCSTFDLHPLRLSRFAEPGAVVETAVL
ncbi:MAG TPA: FAD-dependent oxidoreductase [Candidatus Saccharimonadales bacterium]|nr:FAD-dependent oxidoreductase [Candidatus Saccharimonadales bacterium]